MIASKQRILETGVIMFARKGYGSTGLRDLAEQAGVNLAMVNYFFGSKKGLLKVILDTFLSGYHDIAQQELTSDGDIDTKVRRFMNRIIPYIRANKDYFIVVLTELPHDDPDIIEHKASWIRKIVDLVQDEICTPLSAATEQKITPYLIGPVMIGPSSSHTAGVVRIGRVAIRLLDGKPEEAKIVFYIIYMYIYT